VDGHIHTKKPKGTLLSLTILSSTNDQTPKMSLSSTGRPKKDWRTQYVVLSQVSDQTDQRSETTREFEFDGQYQSTGDIKKVMITTQNEDEVERARGRNKTLRINQTRNEMRNPWWFL